MINDFLCTTEYRIIDVSYRMFWRSLRDKDSIRIQPFMIKGNGNYMAPIKIEMNENYYRTIDLVCQEFSLRVSHREPITFTEKYLTQPHTIFCNLNSKSLRDCEFRITQINYKICALFCQENYDNISSKKKLRQTNKIFTWKEILKNSFFL